MPAETPAGDDTNKDSNTPESGKPAEGDKPKEEPKPVDEKAKAHFLDGLFGGQNHREEPKEESKPDGEKDPKEESKEEPGEEKPKEEPEEEPKEESKEEEKPAAPDVSSVVDAVAEGIKKGVEAASPKTEPKPEEKKDDPDADLSAKDKKKIVVLSELEKISPDQYKGIADKYRQSAKAQKDYIAKWKKDNPGEKFDAKDSDHDDFYDKNNVEWDADDYEEAREKVVENRIRESVKREENERIKKLEKAEQERAIGGKIEEARVSAMSKTLTGVDSKYGEIIKDGVINKEAVKKFSEEEPEIADIVLQSANTTDSVAHEVMRLWNGLSEFDTSVDKSGQPANPIHAFIHSAAIEAEDNILKGDPAGKTKNGKTFATNEELTKMSAEEAAGRWGIGTDEIIAVVASSMAEDAKTKVKKFEEQLEKFAERRGLKPSENGKPQNKEGEKPEEKTEEKPSKPSGSDPANPTNVETGNEKNVSPSSGKEPKNLSAKEKFVDRLIGGQTQIQNS